MLFKKTTSFGFLAVALFGFIVLYRVLPIRLADRENYATLSQSTKNLRSSSALERHPSSQIKLEAQKDVYLTKNGERVHVQMQSDASQFFLTQSKERIEAKEEMEKLICTSSFGELYAEKGAYCYPEYIFDAEAVECIHSLGDLKANRASFESLLKNKESVLLSEGVILSSIKENRSLSIQSEKAFMQAEGGKKEDQKIEFINSVKIVFEESTFASGDHAIYQAGALTLFPKENSYCNLYKETSNAIAKQIQFDLINETILCKQSRGTLHLSEQNPIFFCGDSLLWQKKKNAIELLRNVQVEQTNGFSIQANSAQISFFDQKPKEIQFKENVQLFAPNFKEKELFALADSVEINLLTDTIILKSIAPKRVLVWQEGMRISAPEVHVSKESIQGKGDIRCILNSEEQSKLDEFISKYL